MSSAPKKMKPQKPTAAELDLLRIIWETGPATAKQIHAIAQKNRPEWAYSNVLRLLQIMHSKHILIRDESQRSHIYSAALTQDSQQKHLLKDLIQKVFSGSAKNLVMAALQSHVSKEERAEIQKMLQDGESQK